MTPERWRQIDELFQEALKCPPDERAAYLDEVCADDGTRKEIESLLSFYKQTEGFLEVPAFEAAAEFLCEGQAHETIGLIIGQYKIESRLGFGGMGEVYLAEDTKLDRKVAIKFLPTYLETDELAKKRLVREAKAAAKLDHSNICTIYEVVEESSQTFIVMQHIQGETLASRIRRKPLELRESLDVAAQVADALAEAHSQGIIHRDIKPQNIMITSRGQVKVLDFGLAKVIRSAGMRAQAQSQMSAPGIILGTPPYMSPEQAKSESVDARSDLFSLGVVLYECTTGNMPFSGATPLEICAQVIHHDPPPPSYFNRHVSPELDAIILKALRKDPTARYESAADMLQALRTGGAPLQAEDPAATGSSVLNLGTPALKVVTMMPGILRRPRVFFPVVFVAIAIALLFFFKALTGAGAAHHQPLPDALHWYSIGTNALRNGAYYDASIALQRATAADDNFALGHARLAEAWMELDYADRANKEILRARSLVPDISLLPRLEGLYLQAITLHVLRDFEPAIENYEAITREAADTEKAQAEKAQAYVDLGRTYERNNEIEKAIESYLEATRLAPSDAAAFLRLGIIYGSRQQNLESAEEMFQKAEELYQALRNFEGVTEVFYQRGFLFYNLQRLPKARAQLEKALEIITTTTANDYQQVRAMLVLSSVLADEGHGAQAKQEANDAIQLARAKGIDNQVTSGYIWLGNIFFKLGAYDDAEKYYRQALELAQRDAEHLNEAWALMSIGSVRIQQSNTDEALHYLERARLFYQRGGYRKWLASTLILLGRAYRDKGDHEAALRTFEDLLQQGEQAGDFSQKALSHDEIGALLEIQERYPEALSHYEDSYKINKALDTPFDQGYSAMHCGRMLWQTGRYDEARIMLKRAYSIAKSSEGAYEHLLACLYKADAGLELSKWNFSESKVKCRQSLDLAAQYKTTAVQAKYTLGLAQARSGAPRAGALLCEDAVNMAMTINDSQLLASARLASAEAKLGSGQTQSALETALQAQGGFAQFRQQDSEWRAWVVAALASRRLGEEAAARVYASKAAAGLSSLEQKWGREVYYRYLTRPDVQYFSNQLDQIPKS